MFMQLFLCYSGTDKPTPAYNKQEGGAFTILSSHLKKKNVQANLKCFLRNMDTI